MKSRGLALGACVLLVAAAAGALVVAVSTQKSLIVYTAVAGLVLAAVATLSGNLRLFCMWGLIVTAPTEFSKYFITHRHMGGEYAVRIEFNDVFLAIMLVYWLMDLARERSWVIRLPLAVKCWLVLLAMTVITMIFGTFHLLAGMEVLRMTKLLLLTLLIANQVTRKAQFEQLALALVLGLFVQSAYGVAQYFLHLDLGLERLGESDVMDQSLGRDVRRRIGAMLGHPNILSAYLAMVMPLTLSLIFSQVSRILKIFCGITLALAFTALILTLSRGGWLAFGVATVLLMALIPMHPGLRRRTAVLRMGLLVAGALTLLASSKIIIERMTLSDPTAIDARWEINKAAWKMVKERPVFGWGKNTAAYVMSGNREFTPANLDASQHEPSTIPPIHNIYMQQWAEQGTVGLVVFVAMLGLVLRRAWRNLRIRDETLFALNVGLMAGTLAVMVHGMTDWVYWWNAITRTYWIFAALIFALAYWRAAEEAPVADG